MRIGVNATSVGHRRDREPWCKAGRKAPVNGRVSTRDRSALLYSMAVWRYGPVSAVGTAREGMDGAGDGLQLTLRFSFQPRLTRGVRRLLSPTGDGMTARSYPFRAGDFAA